MKEDLLMENNNKNFKKPLIYGAVAFLVFIVGVIVFALFQNSKSENQIVPVETKPQEVAPKSEKKQNEFQPLVVEEETPKLDKENLIEESEVENVPELETEKEVKKESPVQKKAPKQEKKSVSGNYYIQVAALLKHSKPNKKFLEIIEKSGFNYKFYTTYINKNGNKIKVTKILIGPFKSKTEAKKALKEAKKRITQNAFIFKVK